MAECGTPWSESPIHSMPSAPSAVEHLGQRLGSAAHEYLVNICDTNKYGLFLFQIPDIDFHRLGLPPNRPVARGVKFADSVRPRRVTADSSGSPAFRPPPADECCRGGKKRDPRLPQIRAARRRSGRQLPTSAVEAEKIQDLGIGLESAGHEYFVNICDTNKYGLFLFQNPEIDFHRLGLPLNRPVA